MKRFHVNNKGEPGECSAGSGNCPFGDSNTEHFNTKEGARTYYETKESKKLLNTFSKEKIIEPVLVERRSFKDFVKFEYDENASDLEDENNYTEVYSGVSSDVAFNKAALKVLGLSDYHEPVKVLEETWNGNLWGCETWESETTITIQSSGEEKEFSDIGEFYKAVKQS